MFSACFLRVVVFFSLSFVLPGNVEWKDKQKTSCLIFFRTPAQWGAQIYKWAVEQGKVNSVCTVFEIQQGEDAEGQGSQRANTHILNAMLTIAFHRARFAEFYNIDTETLMKSLQQLEKEGKAQIFTGSSAENLGVKFFTA